MGFFKNLKRIAGDVFDPTGSFGGSGSGLKSAEKRLTGRPDLPQWDYQSQSPYSGNVQWDETGRPVGQMPRGNFALDYQYEADRRTQQRRDVLWSDARQALQRGAGMLESYRPGGAAALSSGVYGQMAGMYGQQAMTQESPDLLMGYREHKQEMADYERKKAEGKARLLSIASMGMSAIGGGMGGAPVGAAMSAAGQQMYPQAIGPQQAQGQGAPVGGLAPGQQGPPVPSNIPGQPFQAQAGGSPQQALQATAGGVGGAQQPRLGDASGGGMPGAPAGGSGGGGAPAAPGGQAGPGGGVGAGGMPPLSLFSSGEAAGMSMASMPLPDEVYERIAEDDDRDEFTYAMQMSATDRLAQAMRSGGLIGRMTRSA